MSPEMSDLARSMGATRLQVFAQFRLPTSLPYLFSGLKVAATLAIAGAVVGEFVGADKGLGYLLLVTNSNMETALMFATIVALTIIGLVFFYSVEFLEALLIPWHVTHRVREEAERCRAMLSSPTSTTIHKLRSNTKTIKGGDEIDETQEYLSAAVAALAAVVGARDLGQRADAREISVPPELDALRRARAVLRRAATRASTRTKGSTSKFWKAAARPRWPNWSPT